MVAPDRIPCCIIGCRRTAPKDRFPDATEIICGKCYRLTPRYLRRRLRRIQKLMLRRGVTGIQGTKPGSVERRLVCLEWEIWDRIKRKAQDAKVGIG